MPPPMPPPPYPGVVNLLTATGSVARRRHTVVLLGVNTRAVRYQGNDLNPNTRERSRDLVAFATLAAAAAAAACTTRASLYLRALP